MTCALILGKWKFEVKHSQATGLGFLSAVTK